jgi:hypothetical protein
MNDGQVHMSREMKEKRYKGLVKNIQKIVLMKNLEDIGIHDIDNGYEIEFPKLQTLVTIDKETDTMKIETPEGVKDMLELNMVMGNTNNITGDVIGCMMQNIDIEIDKKIMLYMPYKYRLEKSAKLLENLSTLFIDKTTKEKFEIQRSSVGVGARITTGMEDGVDEEESFIVRIILDAKNSGRDYLTCEMEDTGKKIVDKHPIDLSKSMSELDTGIYRVLSKGLEGILFPLF